MRSEPGRAPVARALRICIVAAVSTWMLATTLPSITRLWHPLGSFGYRADSNGRASDVAPGSPASIAGLHDGDRFAVARTPMDVRKFTLGPLFLAKVGQTVTLPVIAGDGVRQVTMTAVPQTLSAADRILLVVRTLGAMIFVLIGAALVLLRPSPTTWGFFAFTIGLNPGSDATFDASLPGTLYPANWTLETLAIGIGDAGFLAFALRFPKDELTDWRRQLGRAIPWLIAVMAVFGAYVVLAPYVAAVPTEAASRAYYMLCSCVYLAALVALATTYFRSDGIDRQRMKWVIVGTAIGLPAFALASIFDITSAFPYPPYWVIGVLLSLNLLVPFAIAYGVIRHHVIDISFVISRALVYAVLTAALVAAFALADWVLGRELSSSGLAVAAEVAISIAFAFWLNSLHRRVDRFVDSTLFRARHLAERRLERVARALPHARSQELVSDMLVREPAEALGLASSALFTRALDDDFVRDAAVGWGPADATAIKADDALAAHLEAEQTPIDIHDIRWPRDDIPQGAAHPHLAVPIIVRRRLVGFVLYGGHAGGIALDPDEIRIIGNLMTGAGAAYDHLDAESMRRESQSLRQEALKLQQKVQELQAELEQARGRLSQNANR